MNGLTTQERLDDICKISGLSESIVRRVMDAERQSIANSLRRGERATLIGRCVIRPEIREKVNIGGTITSYVKLKSSPTASLESMLSDLSGFEIDDNDEDDNLPEGIMITQIPALI